MAPRSVVLLALSAAAPAAAQWISAGVKGGVPLTEVADEAREVGRYGALTKFHVKRYTVGPTLEVQLPLGFRFEADGLYKHIRQDRWSGPAPDAVLRQEGRRASVWEIPLLLKRRFGGRIAPFAAAGAALRTVGDFDVDLLSIVTFPGYPPTREHSTEPSNEPLRAGIAAGGGVSFRAAFFRFEPEVRYTHWTSKHFMATTQQVEFLVGLTAGRRR